jgi:hypothetical protein
VPEPSLDQIHPTGTGGNEMSHETGIALEPCLYFRMLVRPVVVHDQMQWDIAGKLGVESTQEFQKFLMPMPRMTFADDLAF